MLMWHRCVCACMHVHPRMHLELERRILHLRQHALAGGLVCRERVIHRARRHDPRQRRARGTARAHSSACAGLGDGVNQLLRVLRRKS